LAAVPHLPEPLSWRPYRQNQTCLASPLQDSALNRLEQSSAVEHLLFEPAEYLPAEHQAGLAALRHLSVLEVQARRLHWPVALPQLREHLLNGFQVLAPLAYLLAAKIPGHRSEHPALTPGVR
jgi:hypothetical protein